MPVIASAFAALIPMTAYLLFIWWFDRYDREPIGMVLKNYLWGAVGAIILTLIWSGIFSFGASMLITDEFALAHFETIIIAPFVEEITKGLFLLIMVFNRKFDNMTDGIVYGGAIGLGFGMTENFLYFTAYANTPEQWLTLVIVRSLFSAVMHCVSTATVGAFLGYAKFKSVAHKLFLPPAGLAIAMFIHAAWNFSVSFESTAIAGFIFLFFTMMVFISVFIISVLNEKKIIYRELSEEASAGIIPAEHLNILNTSKRNYRGWVDEAIRKAYIKAAIRLAFRKMQYKNSSGRNKLFYENEVNYYRNIIIGLLARTGQLLNE